MERNDSLLQFASERGHAHQPISIPYEQTPISKKKIAPKQLEKKEIKEGQRRLPPSSNFIDGGTRLMGPPRSLVLSLLSESGSNGGQSKNIKNIKCKNIKKSTPLKTSTRKFLFTRNGQKNDKLLRYTLDSCLRMFNNVSDEFDFYQSKNSFSN